jgi:hypothetical protein
MRKEMLNICEVRWYAQWQVFIFIRPGAGFTLHACNKFTNLRAELHEACRFPSIYLQVKFQVMARSFEGMNERVRELF